MKCLFVGIYNRGILAASELRVYSSPPRQLVRQAVETSVQGGSEAMAWRLWNFLSPMHTSY